MPTKINSWSASFCLSSVLLSRLQPLLLPFYPLPDLLNHPLQQGLHLLAGGGVDGVDFAFALGVGGGVAALVEVVVDLIDAAGAGFADLADVGSELGSVVLETGSSFVDPTETSP